MRVVVAHGPENNVRDIRQVLHGAGADCAAEDCVLWEELPARLGQTDCDLVVVHTCGSSGVNWQIISDAKVFTRAPLVAIGPNGSSDTEARARQAGVAEYIYRDTMPEALDAALHRLAGGNDLRRTRGELISVVSAAGGSGGSLVALNLAGHYAMEKDSDAAFIEMASGYGKIGMMLDLSPAIDLEGICQRLHRLDKAVLTSSLYADKCGLKLLINSPKRSTDYFLTGDSARKLAILSRVVAKTTVMYVGDRLGPPQMEALKSSDHILMVVRPNVPNVNRAGMTMEELASAGVPRDRFLVVVNFWGQRGQLSKKQVQEALHVDEAVYLPFDDGRVHQAVNHGIMFQSKFKRSRLGRSIAGIAKALAKRTTARITS